MPTTKPRVQVMLPLEVHAALNELRAVSGVSASSFIGSILAESVPMINAVTESFRLVRKGSKAPLEPLKDVLQSAMIETAQLKLDMDKKPRPKLRKTRRK